MEDLKNYEMASRRVDLRDDLASLQAELEGVQARIAAAEDPREDILGKPKKVEEADRTREN